MKCSRLCPGLCQVVRYHNFLTVIICIWTEFVIYKQHSHVRSALHLGLEEKTSTVLFLYVKNTTDVVVLPRPSSLPPAPGVTLSLSKLSECHCFQECPLNKDLGIF